MSDSSKELLDLIDQNDRVIGSEIREVVHARQLRHRECGIWFYTSAMEIIFQKRSPNKKSSPNLLAATVAGHVTSGMSYMEAVLKETVEETGLVLRPEDLKFAGYYDTNKTNNVCITAVYTYCFDRNINKLRVEESSAVGFHVWPITKLLSLSEDEKKLFIFSLPKYIPLFERILHGDI